MHGKYEIAVRFCIGEPGEMMKINKEWLNTESGKYKCPYCEREYSKKRNMYTYLEDA
jgi:aspartate carbamoyltransferase regulatory subunit